MSFWFDSKREKFVKPKNICIYCECCIKDIFINCKECIDMVFCLESSNLPLFLNSDWSADEELKLLENLEKYGLGNWETLSNVFFKKNAIDLERHFDTCYVSSNLGEKHNFQFLSKLQSKEAKLIGYSQLRDDYEREYCNEAENIMKDLHYEPTDNELEINCKYALYDHYCRILHERIKRKEFVKEYNIMASYFTSLDFKDRAKHFGIDSNKLLLTGDMDKSQCSPLNNNGTTPNSSNYANKRDLNKANYNHSLLKKRLKYSERHKLNQATHNRFLGMKAKNLERRSSSDLTLKRHRMNNCHFSPTSFRTPEYVKKRTTMNSLSSEIPLLPITKMEPPPKHLKIPKKSKQPVSSTPTKRILRSSTTSNDEYSTNGITTLNNSSPAEFLQNSHTIQNYDESQNKSQSPSKITGKQGIMLDCKTLHASKNENNGRIIIDSHRNNNINWDHDLCKLVKPFARFIPKSDFLQLCSDAIEYRELQTRISQLTKCKEHGIETLKDAEHYISNEIRIAKAYHQRQKDDDDFNLSGSLNCDGSLDMTAPELKFCENSGFRTQRYLNLKNLILKHEELNTQKEIDKPLLIPGLEKSRKEKIVEFLHRQGYLKRIPKLTNI